MFRFKGLVLFGLLIGGFAITSPCQSADSDCLQYSLYCDTSVTPNKYLFVADVYHTPTQCSTFVAEVYVWVSGNQLPAHLPESCGTGSTCKPRFLLRSVEGETDLPFPGSLCKRDFMLGTTQDGMSIPMSKDCGLPRPSDGISATDAGIVWVAAKSGSIPIKLFRTALDFDKAGNRDGAKPRQIFVGFEVLADGVPLPGHVLLPTVKPGVMYSGTIDVRDMGLDVHTYHFVTQTPLQ